MKVYIIYTEKSSNAFWGPEAGFKSKDEALEYVKIKHPSWVLEKDFYIYEFELS
jgi:hypothetical protein